MAAEKNFENKVKKFLKDKGAWLLKYWGGAAYTKSGIPDLLVCFNGWFLGIELKAPNGRPSDLQLYNLREIEKAGGIGILLYPKDYEQFNEQSFGGNHADYIAKVKGIEGVGSCKVKRVWNGDIRPADMIVSTVVKNWYESIISTVPAAVKPWLDAVYNAAKDKKLTVGGTVHVVITDSDDYGEASSTLVQYVQQTLDPEESAGEGYGLAPIGHVVSVASASPVSIEVKTTVTFEEGHNWSNTKVAIAEAVDAYFLELRKNWSETSQTIVRVSQIENRILGVDGVVDVTGTKLNGTASNMTLTEFCIPKLGGVSA